MHVQVVLLSGRAAGLTTPELKRMAVSTADCLKIRGPLIAERALHLNNVYKKRGLDKYVSLANEAVLEAWHSQGDRVPKSLIAGVVTAAT